MQSPSISAALIGLGIVSGTIYLLNFRLQDLVPQLTGRAEIEVYFFMFLPLSIMYLAGVFLVMRCRASHGNSVGLTAIILLFALLFRCFLVPATPAVLSDDMYRYIWDGRVQQHGINPYLYPPAADELVPLRDTVIYPEINRKSSPTIYPAAAQLCFQLFYAVAGDSVAGFKGLMVVFDLLTLLILTALLRAHGFALARVIIYAWNPLVIFEIAYSGHLEGITVFFVVAAYYLQARGKDIPAVIPLAIASAMKFYPGLLLAALLNRGYRHKGILLFCGILVLLYLPYIEAGKHLAGFLPTYLYDPGESFNLGLKSLLRVLSPGLNYSRLSQVFILVLLAVGVVILAVEKQQIRMLWCGYLLAGLLLILMPASLQPWYVILIIPFLAFFPNPAWLLFSITVALSYKVYILPWRGIPTWVLQAEYLPLFTLLLINFFLGYRKTGVWLPVLLPERGNEK